MQYNLLEMVLVISCQFKEGIMSSKSLIEYEFLMECTR